MVAGVGEHNPSRIEEVNKVRVESKKKVMNNLELLLYNDIVSHPPKRLKSKHPIWDLKFLTESISELLKNQWKKSGMQNLILIEDPMMRVSGFNLLQHIWTALNRARTNQGRSKSLLYKWSMTNSPLCLCRAKQTIHTSLLKCVLILSSTGYKKTAQNRRESSNISQ